MSSLDVSLPLPLCEGGAPRTISMYTVYPILRYCASLQYVLHAPCKTTLPLENGAFATDHGCAPEWRRRILIDLPLR